MGRDAGRPSWIGAAAIVTAGTIALPARGPSRPRSRSGRASAEPVEFEAAAPAPAPTPSVPGAWSCGGRAAPGCRSAASSGRASASTSSGCAGAAAASRPLKLRVRRDGGRWSRWVERSADADHAPDPRRASSAARDAASRTRCGRERPTRCRSAHGPGMRVRDLRLHFVNTTGTATSLDRLRSTMRGAVAGAASAIRTLVGGDASAQTAPPAIVTREEWGGDACPPRAEPAYGEVKLAFVHHTVSANDYGPEDSAAMVLGICRYHRNSNGWNDIGYNFLVDRYGTIFEGRAGGIDEAVVGAQAQGYNSQSTGIASLGTFSTAGQTRGGAARDRAPARLEARGARRAAARQGRGRVGRRIDEPLPGRVAALVRAHLRPPRRQRHRCPGNGLYAQLARLRAMVAPGPPRATTATAASAAAPQHPVRAEGRAPARASASSGTPLPGEAVDVQVLGRLGWRTQHSVRTDAAGTAADARAAVVQPHLRARFAGEAGLLPSSSRPVAIGVRPQVTVSVGARAVAPGERRPGHRYRGAPQDARRAVRQAPDQLGRVGARVASHRCAAIRAAAHDAADAAPGPLPRAACRCVATRATCRRAPAAVEPCRVGCTLRRSRRRRGGRQPPVSPRYSPFPLSSSRAVCSRMRRSRRSDQCSMYQRSSSIRSCHGSAARPLTCAQPVMPGSTARRPSWRGVYCSTCDAHGRARADQAHVAPQHVDQVRQLVEREAAQQRAHARDARIALVHRQPGAHRLGAAHHRAQLQQVEVAAAAAHPALAVDRRAAALEADREAGEREQRRGEQEQQPPRARRRARASPPARRAGAGLAGPRLSHALPLPGRRRAAPQPVPQAGGQRRGHQHVVPAQRERAVAGRSALPRRATRAAPPSVTM